MQYTSRQRRILLGILETAETPLSQKELLRHCRETAPDYHLNTVKRGVRALRASRTVEKAWAPVVGYRLAGDH